MLNIFPIQFLAPVAYLVLRVCIGTLLIRLGFSHMRNRDTLKEIFTLSFFPYTSFPVWCLTLIEIGVGILFLIGLYTQVAAILAMVYSIKFIVLHEKLTHPLIPEQKFSHFSFLHHVHSSFPVRECLHSIFRFSR